MSLRSSDKINIVPNKSSNSTISQTATTTLVPDNPSQMSTWMMSIGDLTLDAAANNSSAATAIRQAIRSMSSSRYDAPQRVPKANREQQEARQDSDYGKPIPMNAGFGLFRHHRQAQRAVRHRLGRLLDRDPVFGAFEPRRRKRRHGNSLINSDAVEIDCQ